MNEYIVLFFNSMIINTAMIGAIYTGYMVYTEKVTERYKTVTLGLFAMFVGVYIMKGFYIPTRIFTDEGQTFNKDILQYAHYAVSIGGTLFIGGTMCFLKKVSDTTMTELALIIIAMLILSVSIASMGSLNG